MPEETIEPPSQHRRGIYAGVGSRKTPTDVCQLMKRIALLLAQENWMLRSGGAEGADQAFQSGVEEFCSFRFVPNNYQEIYLPWEPFEGFEEDFERGILLLEHSADAVNIASHFHPEWKKLSRGARSLILRNGFQILGTDLKTPVDTVICWTQDGATASTTWKSGGTGHAIRIAVAYGIKIYNLQLSKHRELWETAVNTGSLSMIAGL
jgi:hypothetical protein